MQLLAKIGQNTQTRNRLNELYQTQKEYMNTEIEFGFLFLSTQWQD